MRGKADEVVQKIDNEKGFFPLFGKDRQPGGLGCVALVGVRGQSGPDGCESGRGGDTFSRRPRARLFWSAAAPVGLVRVQRYR